MSSEPQTETQTCANPECKVSESGRCLEGLSLDKCPTFGRKPTAAEQTVIEAEDQPAERLVNLRSGTQLQIGDASDLLGHYHARLVAILGPRDAGKTSLIASVFDLFQEGSVEEFSFAGSKTLHAFELACHDSRTASRRTVPVQHRTGHGDVKFYHLDIATKSEPERFTLLLADRAGEDYRTAADDLSQAGPFPEVVRADTVTILIDGGRLLDNTTRHNTRNETKLMIRALAEGSFLQRTPHVIFALTKLDLVQTSDLKDRVFADFDKVVEGARPILTPHVESIDAIHIAAAPSNADTARGTGVAALIKSWSCSIARPTLVETPLKPSRRAILGLQMPSQVAGAVS